MRKPWIWIAALLLVAIALWSLPGKVSPAPGASAPPSADGAPKSEERAAAPAPPGSAAPAPEGERLLLHATAHGAPVASAELIVYLRGAREPGTGHTGWKTVARASADSQGSAAVQAPRGPLLAVARAPGFAPARVELPDGPRPDRVDLLLEPGAEIAGRVLDAHTREPIPLARVSTADGALPDEERAATTCDARGAFRLPGLPLGGGLLAAEAEGYARATAQANAPGAQVELLLSAAAFLAGHVVDASGKPAAGATLIAEPAPPGRPGLHAPEPVFGASDANGAFSLEVAPGAQRLKAQLGAFAAALPSPVMADAGRTLGGLVLQLAPGASIAGALTGEGQPVRGAEAILSPRGIDGELGRAQSDAAGAFTFEGLAPGVYDVDVTAPGWLAVSHRGIALLAGVRFELKLELHKPGAIEGSVQDESGRPVAAQVSATDAAGPVATSAEGKFRLEGVRPGTVRVSARLAENSSAFYKSVEVREGVTARVELIVASLGTVYGTVTAPQGKLPDLIYFTSRSAPAVSPPGSIGAPAVDAHDPFAVTHPEADGSYSIRVAPGSWSAMMIMNKGGGVTPSSSPVEVEAGRETRLDLTFDADGVNASEQASGVVLEPDGTPSAGATISQPPATFTSTTADGEGRFSINLMQRGQAPVTLKATNGGRSGSASATAGQTDLILQLKPAATLHGALLGDPPPAGFTLNAYPAGGSWSANDALQFAGNSYSLSDLPAQKTNLRAHTDDGRLGTATVDLSQGGDAAADIQLETACTVTGRVLAAGAPAAGKRVNARNTATGANQWTSSSPDGTFTLPALAAGSYTVTSGSASLPLTVTSDSQCPLALGDLSLAAAP